MLAPRCRLILVIFVLRDPISMCSILVVVYVSWVQNDVSQFGLYLWIRLTSLLSSTRGLFGLVFFFFFFLEASLISFNIIILGCVTHLKVIIFRYPCPTYPLVEITPDIQDLLLLLRKRVRALIPPSDLTPDIQGL